MKYIVVVLFILLSSMAAYGQDSLEYYQKHSTYIQSELVDKYGLEDADKQKQLEGLSVQCISYYNQIQIFIKVMKYENRKSKRESLKVVALRELRNKVCKKHIEILEKLNEITGEEEDKIDYWKHRYTIFLK